MPEQKRLIIRGVLSSLLLLSSLSTMTTATSLRAGSKLPVGFDYEINQDRLLKHAIKVERSHLRSRKLEGGEDQQEADNEGENEGQQENNNNENDNNNNENQNENQNENENNDQNQEQEQDNEQEQQNEQDQQNDNNDEDQEQQNEAEENQEENNQENNQEQNGEEEDQEAEADENDDAAQNDDQVDGDAEEEDTQINFLKCVALTIEPNIMDIEGMLENGEIDEDEAAELEKKYIKEMTSSLNTQESVVFFTYGNGEDDEDREVFMVGINDWIAASTEYDETCNAIDEDDVDIVFAKIPSFMKSPVEEYSDHVWYSGFNCKADGTGFKPQLFLDESCTIFSPNMNDYYPFRKATEEYSTEVASDLTKYMIQDANDSISYTQDCDGSDFCNNVLEKSVELATCEAAAGRRKLASYQLENDMASEIGDACPSIQTAFSIDQEYEFTVDDLESLVSFWSNTFNGGQESDHRSLVPGTNDIWIALLGIFAFLCVASSLVVSRTKTSKRRHSKTPSVDTDEDSLASKKEPLVIKRVHPLGDGAPNSDSDLLQSFSAIECTLSKKVRRKHSETPEKRKSRTTQFRSFLKNSLSNTSSTSKGLSVD